MHNWQGDAYRLFFKEGKKITDISQSLGKTRKTISSYLATQEGYEDEKQKRKAANAEKRSEYQRQWEQQHRSGLNFSGVSLKRQHEIDVRVLSAEKHYH